MAITFTGSKTVTIDLAPHLLATALTSLLAIAPENLTVAQFFQLADALDRVPEGHNPAKTLTQLLV
jgi:hypothetical protein